MRIPSLNSELNPEPQDGMRPPWRWKRVFAWLISSTFAVILLVIGGASVLLHSARFHTYLLKTIERKASAALGSEVRLQNFSFQLATLRADLYGLTIDGASPHATPPLLQVQHIEVSIHIVSFVHYDWYLRSLCFDSPVIKLFTDTKGITNLPQIKSSSSGNSLNIFQLGIRHASLRNGTIYINDREIPLEADLHQLTFRAHSIGEPSEYSGNLSYKDGSFQTGSFKPIPHNFDASFTVTPTTFKLTNATLRSGSSRLDVVANVSNYAAPAINAHYAVTLSGGDLRAMMQNESIPSGTAHANGTVQYNSVAGRPLLSLITLNGELESQGLVLHTPQLRTQIRNIGATYSLTNGTLSVTNLRANVLGGQILGNFTMNDLWGDTHSLLSGTLRELSLGDVQRLLPASTANQAIQLKGAANGSIHAVWGKTLQNLVAQFQATIHGNIANKNGLRSLPLDSVIHGTYIARSQEIELANSYMKMPQTSLALNGALSNQSQLNVRFHSADLREVQLLAEVFQPSIAEAATPLGLAGQASFQGTLHGSVSNPQIAGKLIASNVHLKGTIWPSVQSGIAIDPQSASVHHAALSLLPHGSLHLNGSIGLQHWAFNKKAPVQIQLEASRFPVRNLDELAGLQSRVTGELAATANLRGTGENLIGSGSLTLAHGVAYDEPIQSANLVFDGTTDSVHGDLKIKLSAGEIHSVLTIQPMEQTYTAQLDADNIELGKLQALKVRSIDAVGAVNINADGHGTFQNPSLTARLQIPKLSIQNHDVSNIQLALNIANHIAIATLNSHAVNTSIQAHGKVSLSGDYQASAALDTQMIPLEPFVALYAPAVGPEFSGQTEVHATLQGPLKQKHLLIAHVSIPTLRASYGKTIYLAATSPIHADYSNGVLEVQRTTIQGTDTNLQLQASVPFYGTQPISGRLVGSIDLQLAQLFSSDIRSSGKLILNINSNGSRVDPKIAGEILIQDANYANGTLPMGLQHGNGVLTLTNDRLNIRSFQGSVGGGTLTAQGGVNYRPALQFDLGATAHNVRLLYPEGLREELSANLRLIGNKRNAQLGGFVQVSNVSFTPAFDLMNFIGNLSGGIAAPPTPGFSQNLHLNLAVDSTNGIDLVSRTLSLNGTANLQVRGTAAEPVILGRVNLNNGDVVFNGNRFVVNGGTVQFVNPSETEPVVNLRLDTTIEQYNIHLRFNGPVNQIQTNYASDPSLPSADIINLLAFGETTEANAANPATPGNVAAESLLASQVSSQITSRVSKIAGISQLSINPVLAGGSTQGPAGAIVTVQQRVTGNFFVTFSTNVTTTQDQIIMGQYQLSPRVAVTGTRDQNGGFALDTIFKKTW